MKTPPIDYIKRTRAYYLALGYDNPYQWAHYDDVPFQGLSKPLSEMVIALVATAAPYQPDKGDQGPGAPYNAEAKFYRLFRQPVSPPPDLRISHIAIDRTHSRADDINSYFPLTALRRAEKNGVIGGIAPYFYGLPTNRSQKTTIEQDCAELVSWIETDRPDAVIGLPNCPVCHQSVSLAMRALEAAGTPTVIMGCARDVVEHAGVPRFHFSDFPLGNAAGLPHKPEAQYASLIDALGLFETATKARTTFTSPQIWSEDESWKDDYSNPDKLTADEIAARRQAFDAAKSTAATLRTRQ